MKRLVAIALLLVSGFLSLSAIEPYLLVAKLSASVQDASTKTIEVLESDGYEVIGQYRPGNNPDLFVVVFTSSELKALCKKSEDRGMLAAAMKVGFQNTGGSVNVSLLNPEYLFYAYFRDKMEEERFKSSALSLSSGIKNSMKKVGSLMTPFGGDLSVKDLKKYRYMVGMPNFDSPVKLAEFDSFDTGLSTIQKQLSRSNSTRVKVYEIVDKDSKIAVFGVGLSDPKEGEAHFLPIIGESHVAAMPYELILQDKQATMLHGRFRFASHWPELKMKTFTKIMSSPGDVEDAMKSLVE
jgi:hypothetical protein